MAAELLYDHEDESATVELACAFRSPVMVGRHRSAGVSIPVAVLRAIPGA
jgi:hypothetical protein